MLQHGHKYPQNSSMTLFSVHSMKSLVNFTFLERSSDKNFENSQIFVQCLTKLKIRWCNQLSETLFFSYWNATPYLSCLQNCLQKSFTKSCTRSFKKSFTKITLTRTEITIALYMVVERNPGPNNANCLVFALSISDGSLVRQSRNRNRSRNRCKQSRLLSIDRSSTNLAKKFRFSCQKVRFYVFRNSSKAVETHRKPSKVANR